MSKIIAPRPCAWCHEPFTPHKSRSKYSVDGLTQTCQVSCAKRLTGAKAKALGTIQRATAARKAKCTARIEAIVAGLTPIEAFRVGVLRGYQQGAQALKHTRRSAA